MAMPMLVSDYVAHILLNQVVTIYTIRAVKIEPATLDSSGSIRAKKFGPIERTSGRGRDAS